MLKIPQNLALPSVKSFTLYVSAINALISLQVCDNIICFTAQCVLERSKKKIFLNKQLLVQYSTVQYSSEKYRTCFQPDEDLKLNCRTDETSVSHTRASVNPQKFKEIGMPHAEK